MLRSYLGRWVYFLSSKIVIHPANNPNLVAYFSAPIFNKNRKTNYLLGVALKDTKQNLSGIITSLNDSFHTVSNSELNTNKQKKGAIISKGTEVE